MVESRNVPIVVNARPKKASFLYLPLRCTICPPKMLAIARLIAMNMIIDPDTVADNPITPCRNRGKNNNEPNIPALRIKTIILDIVNTLFLNKNNGKIGWRTFRSTNKKRAKEKAEVAIRLYCSDEFQS